MKFQTLSALLLLALAPLGLMASSDVDRKIEQAAESSYNYRTVLADNVKVKAHHGIVTLSGTVPDQDDRTLAVATVENLPGVREVKNEIIVQPDHPEYSDSWMAMKIRARLLVKGNVSAVSTQVAVENGIVTLTGTADNRAQKELTAIYAADIAGVKSVVNETLIQDNPETGQTLRENIDDASITGQLKFTLLTTRATSALRTKVTTVDGVITITGEASSRAEKSLVTKLAQDVRGVTSVVNDMSVKE